MTIGYLIHRRGHAGDGSRSLGALRGQSSSLTVACYPLVLIVWLVCSNPAWSQVRRPEWQPLRSTVVTNKRVHPRLHLRSPPIVAAQAVLPTDATDELPGIPQPRRANIPLAGNEDLGSVQISKDEGNQISLIVRNAPISRVLAMLAQSEGLNIVHGDDITASISITLKDVAVEDALTAMLSVAGYRWAQQNNIIHVTSASRAKTLPAGIQGRQMQVFGLDYASAATVQEAVQGLLSPAGSAFSYDAVATDNRRTQEYVVVEDTPEVLGRVSAYLAQVDVPPRQVLIEAHILQVELNDDLQHGVNFSHLFDVSSNQVKLQTKGLANPSAAQAFFATIEGGNLESLVEALQTTTDAKTLASPRLLVLNGQSARLQVGEQLGFRVVTVTETASLESVEFLEVGIVLAVTPRISRDNRIVLHVKPEISTGDVNPETGLPEEETTEVETDLILNDGQGMVIGGLIREEDRVLQSKIPLLGDTWLIGTLFQRSEVTKARSEIIVALVPRLLPYDGEQQLRNEGDLARARSPIVVDSLKRVPRPEPSLPDANPHRSRVRWHP